jgi:putative ATPase
LTASFPDATIDWIIAMNQILRETNLVNRRKLLLVQGDITAEEVDAIVNAANSQLRHGGGLAAAILRRGGAAIQQESDDWIKEHGPVSHAEPACTRSGNLPCRYVIHAVGPVWGEGGEDSKLAAAVVGALKLADSLALNTLAIPAISTGIFGFPKARAAGVILQAIQDYSAEYGNSSLEAIRITLYDESTVDAFIEEWENRFTR